MTPIGRFKLRDRNVMDPNWRDNWFKVSGRANVARATAPDEDPKTYEEAMSRPDAELWQRAMDEEIESLHKNGTWVLETLPVGVKPISTKWVFKTKRDAKGNIERYKARLVAKGFQQREGIDFTEVFAPVSKHTTLRTFLSIVTVDDLELLHLDVKTAFLHGELEEDIYMKQPQGYEEGGPDTVCHLRKALYGLRQAPRAWHARLKKELESLGCVASEADPGLYILRVDKPLYLLVYVDDLLIAGAHKPTVDKVAASLQAIFDIRNLGEATYFLGFEITRDRTAGTLKIDQKRMTTELVDKYGLGNAKSKSTPLSVAIKLTKEGTVLDRDKFGYSELVGSLLYLSVCTRPDIAQAVGALARYMAAPTVDHWTAAKGVVRYLASTPSLGIIFDKTSNGELLAFCDADHAGDIDTRRSTTGYTFILNGGIISWSSRLQQTVAASTTEAEYMAAASATKEALWLRKLMADFDKPVMMLTIYSDNQASISLLKNPITSARSKHIDIIYHFARERVLRKEVEFVYCNSEDNVADIMTKALPESKFVMCRDGMGMCE